ncbi:MAG: glycosyltransferase family 39 protein [bacterium]|nr:glycosyltransferase family 39 protein [bacterium]
MIKLQNHIPKAILSLIIVSAFLLMLGSAKQDSAVMDELAHIPAGYSYIKFFDYRLNPEHPPLIKALSALPLLFQGLKFPVDGDAWQNQTNAQWEIGKEFLYNSGNDVDKIIFYSRLAPMLLLLILIGFTYFWANELTGKWWALLPALLIAFSPNFLAHGHYVATDIGATLGILVSSYYFLRFINKPSRKNIVVAGIVFGVAELLKFSAVLLVPFFILIVSILLLEKIIKEIKSPVVENKLKKIFKFFYVDFGRLLLIFAVGGALIYLIYGLFTLNYPAEKQYSDTASILQSFDNNFLTESVLAMSQNTVLRPLSEYFLGILMVIKKSSEGSINYFLGEVSNQGSPLYFPIIFIMKETLPTLIIVFTAFLLGLWGILKTVAKGRKNIKNKFFEYFTTNFSELSMLIFVAGYWLYSMNSNLNIGFRHIMPMLPFIYILSAQAVKKLFYIAPPAIPDTLAQKFINMIRKILNLGTKSVILAGLLIWLITGAIFANPYYLSRFNEFFGGTFDGYKYATDSNFDWGQDLKRLKEFLDNPPDTLTGQAETIDKVAVDYFGGGNVKYYLGDKAEDWNSAMGSPLESGIKWLAISIHTLQNAIGKKADNFDHNPQDEYLWLENSLSPDYKAGTSIFIYRLEQ